MKKLYFTHARHALFEILNTLNIGKGDGVLIPSFVCRDLLAPIYEKKAIPFFYDVNKDLEPILLIKDKKIRAVISVNYFGFPQQLKIFKDYCSVNKCALIEDNAHGYLSRDTDNNLLGTRGDFGIYSFRKTISFSHLGMLRINNSLYIKNNNQVTFSSDGIPFILKVKKILIYFQRITNLKFVAFGEDFIRFFRLTIYGSAILDSSIEEEFKMPKLNPPKIKSLEILKEIDNNSEIQRRVELFNFFNKELKNFNIDPVFTQLLKNTCPKGYPFFADNINAEKVKKFARSAKGLNCIKWPNLPNSYDKEFQEFYSKVYLINFIL